MRTTMADLYERWYDWIALWLFIFACQNLFELVAWHFGGTVGARFAIAADGARTAAFIVLFASVMLLLIGQTRFLWSVTGPKDLKQRSQLRPDTYVFAVIRRASVFAWIAVFSSLLLLDRLSNHIELPGEQVIQLVIFLLGATFSLAYLGLNLRGRFG